MSDLGPVLTALGRMEGNLLLVVLLYGCSVNSPTPVPGWPSLKVVEHYVPHSVMRDKCAPYVAGYSSPEACAEFRLKEGECHLWFSADFPPPSWLVEHEREHCRGHDHIGSDNMHRLIHGNQRR